MSTTEIYLYENKELVRSIPERILTNGETGLIDEVFADDFVEHNPYLGDVYGPDGFREHVYEPFRRAFPDLTATVEDVLAEGDRVFIRVSLAGTHEGEFMGIAPSGRRMNATAFALHRVADGRVAERWTLFDGMGIRRQLEGDARAER